MNNAKTENFLGLLATGIIAAVLLFTGLREPLRIASAQQNQLQADLDEAMTLYAENCSVCHGLAGEGIGATPALDSSALRSSDYDSLFKIISRGLFGTSMPAWNKEDGGPLGDYQVGELVALIQYGDWQETSDRVINLGLAPSIPLTSQPDPAILAQISTLPQGETLARAVTLYSTYCIACHGADGLGSALAPALNDPLVQAKPVGDLESTILNGVPGTLMASWDNRLQDQDLADLVTLIQGWDQVPAGAIPAPEQPVMVTEESLALGADLFSQNCARCHGPEGQGTPRAPSLNVKGFLADTNDAALQQIITMGVPNTSMPSWGDRLTEIDIQAIVGFIRSWEPTAPEVAEPARGGGPWWRSGSGNGGGGQGGGPPWMRNSTSTNTQILPSGGDAAVGTVGTGQSGTGQSPAGWQTGQGGLAAGIRATVSEPFDPQALIVIITVLAISILVIRFALKGLNEHNAA